MRTDSAFIHSLFSLPQIGVGIDKPLNPNLFHNENDDVREIAMVQKKILVLGSGLVAKPCVDYLLRDAKNELTVGGCISNSPANSINPINPIVGS